MQLQRLCLIFLHKMLDSGFEVVDFCHAENHEFGIIHVKGSVGMAFYTGGFQSFNIFGQHANVGFASFNPFELYWIWKPLAHVWRNVCFKCIIRRIQKSLGVDFLIHIDVAHGTYICAHAANIERSAHNFATVKI